MENRYFYIDRDGRVQGPFWLSIMRDLWKGGRLMMSTEVSLTGVGNWDRIEFHPEIFEFKAQMPPEEVTARPGSNPVRLLVWMILLFLAYATWLIVHWDGGSRPRFDETPTEPKPAEPELIETEQAV